MIVLIEPSQFDLTATVLELGLALAVTTCVSAAVTRVIGAAGHRWQLTDQPNDRSSHIRPTPTGGGLGIILGIWAGFACLLFVRAPLPAFPTWGGGRGFGCQWRCGKPWWGVKLHAQDRRQEGNT